MFDFPASPTNGQTITGAAGQMYVFNGTSWTAQNVAAPFVKIAGDTMSGNLYLPILVVDPVSVIPGDMAVGQIVRTGGTFRYVNIVNENQVTLSANVYNISGGSSKYLSTNPASMFQVGRTGVNWSVSPSANGGDYVSTINTVFSIDNSGGNASIYLTKQATTGQNNFIYGKTTYYNRWYISLGDSMTETANQGSNFAIGRHNDAGTLLDIALLISRLNADVTLTGNLLPATNNTRNIGSTSLRWSTVYTADLSLNNGIGDWTLVEGEDDLFLYNNKKGKTYKFTLTEVDPSTVPSKRPE